MIDLKADCGSGGGVNTSLPTPPAKAARNTADITATWPSGITSGDNGKFSYTYYHWDVRDVVPNCRFGITDSAIWGPSSVMSLRNDATNTTVWTKAYSTLGTSGPQAVCFDLIGGFVYIFVHNSTRNETRLWRVHLSDGTATQIAAAPGASVWGDNAVGYMLARFTSQNVIELIGYTGSANVCSRRTFDVSNGTYTTETTFNSVGYLAPGESWTLPTGGSNPGAPQYITSDGKISVVFTPADIVNVPVAASGASGGNRGAVRSMMITRGLGRCGVNIVDPNYNTPYSIKAQNQMIVTDNRGAMAMICSHTQYVPGFDGRFEFYDAADFDRWLKEIADEAGLPAGGFW